MRKGWGNHRPGDRHYLLEQELIPCRITTRTIVTTATTTTTTITLSTNSCHQLDLFTALVSAANSLLTPHNVLEVTYYHCLFAEKGYIIGLA